MPFHHPELHVFPQVSSGQHRHEAFGMFSNLYRMNAPYKQRN